MKKIKGVLLLLFASILVLQGCTQTTDLTTSSASIIESIAETTLKDNLKETDKIDVLETVESISNTDNILNSNSFEVDYIDVGQGDCELIICNNQTMLIDSGEKEYGQTVINYLTNKGIEKIDYIIVTHPHSDHMGSMGEVINYFKPTAVILPDTQNNTKAFENMLSAIEATNADMIIPSVADTYNLGSSIVTVLAPNSTDYEDLNNYSIVVRIDYGNTSFLFTGDAEDVSENEMLNNGLSLKADVLKVGHHGSNSSSTSAFLAAVSPKYAVIEVGAGNDYGHPTQKTLDKLNSCGIKVYRTDLNGNISMISDGDNIVINTDKDLNANIPSEVIDNATEEELSLSASNASNDSVSMDYILNKNSMKFHLPSCSAVSKISDKNKEEVTDTRDNLINNGYEPCGMCKP